MVNDMVVQFEELYRAETAEQRERYQALRRLFEQEFSGEGEPEYFSAPGRTEVGGNHTDHNHGCVLAAAINLDVIGAVRKTGDHMIRLKSAEYPGVDMVNLSDLAPKEEEQGRSVAVIKGICAKCRELGFEVGGFEAYTMTRVLKGSGLSSSAAFEILVVTIISHLFNEDGIDPVTAAIIAQYAENVYFGKPSGLMDQMASSVGGFTAIDFESTEQPKIEKIGFDLTSSGHALCIVDTGGNHANLTGEYAAIPREMKSVAAYFGKEYLREVDEAAFYRELGKIREQTGDRAVLRAMHFFDDNRYAVSEAEALKAGDFELFRRYILASGQSSVMRLQNVFAVIDPDEQGLTLALALTAKILNGQGAYRVHGGGFAGTIQAFVPVSLLDTYRQEIEQVFGAGHCYVLSIRQAGGTKVELS